MKLAMNPKAPLSVAHAIASATSASGINPDAALSQKVRATLLSNCMIQLLPQHN